MENNETVSQSSDSSAAEEQKQVSYETYRRAVGEVKQLKQKLNELLAQKEAEEQARLAEQGKWKEKAELLERSLKEKENKFSEVVNQFAKRIFTESAKQVAAQVGVKKEAIDDVLKVADFSDVEIGEDFSIDSNKLKAKFEELAKHKPWYFEHKSEPIKTLPSLNANISDGQKKNLADLSWDELKQLAKQINE